ncbi:hypothetical protein [Alicycliphilus denitrificans]|uniref:hypothetical protein n=1 Tax=Alicycliphilus denitrificans TaxID=179636 RepID=UPI001FD141B6|nr:hypothetical protein [Alicycliphilus denitrificans]
MNARPNTSTRVAVATLAVCRTARWPFCAMWRPMNSRSPSSWALMEAETSRASS